jgi:glutamine synthetase
MNTLGNDLSWPYRWPIGNYPKEQGNYYCSSGNKNCFGRDIVDVLVKACIYAGVNLYGTKAGAMPSQWEFQIGNCNGIEIGDHLWIARYLLQRIGEMYKVDISFDPKPVPGDWSKSEGHINYSDNITRNDRNMEGIIKQMENLKNNHERLLKLYGERNNNGIISNFIFLYKFFSH